MITFEQVFNFDSLYRSHLRARCCKRHKRDVVNFEINLAENLTKLTEELNNGTYKIRGYHKFMIYDPKEREIQALSYYDRIVQSCLCYNYLVPVFTKKLIYDNGACQLYKGTHFARNRFAKFLTEYYKRYGNTGYVLKLDVKKYFLNVNHEVLKAKFESQIFDPKLKKMVMQIIDSFEYSPGKGIPMGNQSSQIFALYYLDELDRIIKTKFKIKYYVRYMDDLILLHNDKNYLIEIFDYVKEYVKTLKIDLNEKSMIFSLKNSIEFLGIKYHLSSSGKVIKKMKNQSKVRMKRRIKQLIASYDLKLIDKSYIKMSLAGFKGNTKRLSLSTNIRRYYSNLKQKI